MTSLAVVILTYNEEKHIERVLACVRGIAEQIFVVDSFSSDATVELAKAHGATVLQNKFINYARQFQWALENAPITADWIMRLDADEIIEPDLAAEIRAELPQLPPDVAGINLNRKTIFLGRWIKHGGRYPMFLLRIWRRGQGRIEDRWMDEHMVVEGGRVIDFKGGFADHNLNDLTFWTEKHNKYATREAIESLNAAYSLFESDPSLLIQSHASQAKLKRWLKTGVFDRFPFWLGAPMFFVYRYFIRLGFLDGIEGLIYHFLQGWWYRFLVGAKVVEFRRALAKFPARKDKARELSRLTGFEFPCKG
jgi:glycosyltransferase involved in cell wall biosynthesis